MGTVTEIRAAGRVLVAVDGANLRGSLQYTDYDRIDAEGLRTWARAYGRPSIEWFQGAYTGNEAFLQVLRSRSIRVHAPQPKKLPGGQLKCDLDVLITVSILRQVDAFDTVVLFSGDGDFEPLVIELQRRQVRVVIVGKWGTLAPELVQHLPEEDLVSLDDALRSFGRLRTRDAA